MTAYNLVRNLLMMLLSINDKRAWDQTWLDSAIGAVIFKLAKKEDTTEDLAEEASRLISLLSNESNNLVRKLLCR